LPFIASVATLRQMNATPKSVPNRSHSTSKHSRRFGVKGKLERIQNGTAYRDATKLIVAACNAWELRTFGIILKSETPFNRRALALRSEGAK
jgi:hypothetical protein